MLWKKHWCRTKKNPLLDFIVILLRPEALEEPHMTILKLGKLFCMLCWMVHGLMRIQKEAWFGVKLKDNLYNVHGCLLEKNKAWTFSRSLKISIRREIQMTRGRYEDYWLPGALCRFFAKKADKILEVRPQNYENATIYVVQRITNMGYTTT